MGGPIASTHDWAALSGLDVSYAILSQGVALGYLWADLRPSILPVSNMRR